METLDGLDESVRGQFLRQFFRTIAQIDFTDAQSNDYWERILLRRRELAENLGKRVSLKTALVDVLASTNFLRVPILMEYDGLRRLCSTAVYLSWIRLPALFLHTLTCRISGKS